MIRNTISVQDPQAEMNSVVILEGRSSAYSILADKCMSSQLKFIYKSHIKQLI